MLDSQVMNQSVENGNNHLGGETPLISLYSLIRRFRLKLVTSLSRDRLIKLYKEIRGVSPPKGLLPFSTDWFITWLSNIHSSMFYNIYRFMVTQGGCTRIAAIIKSYRLYLEQVQLQGSEPVLDFTRAWTLVRFFDCDMLQLSTCTRCTGQFVAHAYDT